MSCCSIILFRDSKPSESIEFGNSWLGAAWIWNCLYDKYLKNPQKEFDSWMNEENSRKLWALADREDLPDFEKNVLVATFDHAIVEQKNFARFAADLRRFADEYKAPDHVHLRKWADAIEKADCEAIGFHMTSVSANPWFESKDFEDSIPYDLKTGTKHFEVYE